MTRRRSPQQADPLVELPPISYVWETPNRRPRRAEWDTPDPAVPRRLTPAMRAKLERIVSRVPEVMVKITGRTKVVAHLKSHLAYITRNGELDAETEQAVMNSIETLSEDLTVLIIAHRITTLRNCSQKSPDN